VEPEHWRVDVDVADLHEGLEPNEDVQHVGRVGDLPGAWRRWRRWPSSTKSWRPGADFINQIRP
jgi:hypothetical protein